MIKKTMLYLLVLFSKVFSLYSKGDESGSECPINWINIGGNKKTSFSMNKKGAKYSYVKWMILPKIDYMLIGEEGVEEYKEYPIDQEFTYVGVEGDSTDTTIKALLGDSTGTNDPLYCDILINHVNCYITCDSCEEEGNSISNKCSTCKNGFYLVQDKPGQCVEVDPSNEIVKYALDEEKNTYFLCNKENDFIYHKCINCQKENKYFYKGKCVDKNIIPSNTYLKDPQYNLYDDCYRTCEKCQQGGNKTEHHCERCIDKLGSIDSSKKEFNCVSCLDEGKYYLDRKCYDDILEGYYPSEKNELKKCFEKCRKCRGPGDEINNNCETCLTGGLVDKKGNCNILVCPEYLKKIENRCQNCAELNMYYYKGDCLDISALPPNVYNSDEKYNYMKDCNENCLQCSFGGTQASDNCEKCKNDLYLTSQGNCVSSCPQYSVADEDNKLCYDCKEKGLFYYENKCLSSCPTDSIHNEVNNICIDEKKIRNDCSNHGKFNQKTNRCICQEGFSGTFCEVENLRNQIEIYSVKRSINANKETALGFQINNKTIFKSLQEGDISISWNVSINDTLTGVNEPILKLKKNTLKSGKELSLTLENKKTKEIYTALMKPTLKEIDPNNFFVKINFPGDMIKACETNILISVVQKKEIEEIEYCFKYNYLNIYEDTVPLEGNCDYIGKYIGTIPYAKAIIIEIINSVNEIVTKTISIKVTNTFESKSVNEIITPEIIQSLEHNQFIFASNKLLTGLINRTNPLKEDEINLLSQFGDKILNNKFESSLALQVFNAAIVNKNLQIEEGFDEYKSRIVSIAKIWISEIEDSIEKKEIYPFYYTVNLLLSNKMTDGKEMIRLINNKMKKLISPGELVKIKTETYSNFILNPSSKQRKITINFENELLSDSVGTYSVEKDCDESDSLFCLEESSYKRIKNEISYLNKIAMNSVSINILSIKDDSKSFSKNTNSRIMSETVEYPKFTSLNFLSYITYLTEENNVEELSEISSYKYSISLPNDLDPLLKSTSSSKVCTTINSIKSYSTHCNTYFNYEKKRTICKCKGAGEITGVISTVLSNFSKLLQFPKLTLQKLNHFTISFTLTTLFILTIATITVLFIDFCDDTKKLKQISKKTKTIKELNKAFYDCKNLSHLNIFNFCFFATSYIFPYIAIFNVYHYENPRYVRLLIEMLSLILSVVFSILPYYFSEFTYKEIFINERDIEKISWNIHSLPSKLSDVLYSVLYSAIASIFIRGLITFFSIIVNYRQLLHKIWDERRKMIKLYTKKYIMIEYVKNKSWKKMQNKLRAFYAFMMIYKKNYISKFELVIDDNIGEIMNQAILNNNILKKNNRETKYKDIKICCEIPSLILNGKTKNEQKRRKLKVKKRTHNSKKECRLKNSSFFSRSVFEEINNDKRYFSDCTITVYNPSYTIFSVESSKIQNNSGKKYIIQQVKTLLVTVGIVMFLIFIYYWIFVIFTEVYQKYEFYIIKIWLYPQLFSILIGRIITNYFINFIEILIIEFFYERRHYTKLLEMIFKFLIPKYLINMVKVKKMINKYYKYYIGNKI